jgi:hypothetical protein
MVASLIFPPYWFHVLNPIGGALPFTKEVAARRMQ